MGTASEVKIEFIHYGGKRRNCNKINSTNKSESGTKMLS
jgi:hypothetical protein